jgi:hypothetical protein
LPNREFQTGDQANPIVDDNLAQELLYEQFITDIAVDGANNKWIGTADSGFVFNLTNGQNQYINNSPLPSNVINDIDINSSTGEVIATGRMISFKGIATKASEDLTNVYVYQTQFGLSMKARSKLLD